MPKGNALPQFEASFDALMRYQALFIAYADIAPDFNPEEFFAEFSRYDVMRMGVAIAREGVITLSTVMDYVQASFELSGDDANEFAVKMYLTLKQLSEDEDLPFQVEPLPKTPKTRQNKQTRKPRKKTARKKTAKKRGRTPGRKPKKSGGRKIVKGSRKDQLIQKCGSEAKARTALIDAIRQAAADGERGPKAAGVKALGAQHKLPALAQIEAWNITGLLKSFGITSADLKLAGK